MLLGYYSGDDDIIEVTVTQCHNQGPVSEKKVVRDGEYAQFTLKEDVPISVNFDIGPFHVGQHNVGFQDTCFCVKDRDSRFKVYAHKPSSLAAGVKATRKNHPKP